MCRRLLISYHQHGRKEMNSGTHKVTLTAMTLPSRAQRTEIVVGRICIPPPLRRQAERRGVECNYPSYQITRYQWWQTFVKFFFQFMDNRIFLTTHFNRTGWLSLRLYYNINLCSGTEIPCALRPYKTHPVESHTSAFPYYSYIDSTKLVLRK